MSYNTYVTNNYAGAIINMDNGKKEYMCPKCHSNETRAIRLSTEPPKSPKIDDVMPDALVRIVYAICTVLAAYALSECIVKDAPILFYIICGLLFLFCLYMTVFAPSINLEIRKENEQKKKDHERALYNWLHTYHCLRCGMQFWVNEHK